MHEHIMSNYGGHNLSTKQKVFYYRLCKARKYVECPWNVFGILSNKWRVFHSALNLYKDLTIQVVKACVVLHNIVREMDGYTPADLVECALKPVNNNNNNTVLLTNSIYTQL